MAVVKEFAVHSPLEIPEMTEQHFRISDWFLAKGIGLSGNVKPFVVAYYFDIKEWRSCVVGMKELLEYYTEK